MNWNERCEVDRQMARQRGKIKKLRQDKVALQRQARKIKAEAVQVKNERDNLQRSVSDGNQERGYLQARLTEVECFRDAAWKENTRLRKGWAKDEAELEKLRQPGMYSFTVNQFCPEPFTHALDDDLRKQLAAAHTAEVKLEKSLDILKTLHGNQADTIIRQGDDISSLHTELDCMTVAQISAHECHCEDHNALRKLQRETKQVADVFECCHSDCLCSGVTNILASWRK